MLRHACGYKLANDGQDTRAVQHYLGHRNIQHTVRQTELSAERFKSFWEDCSRGPLSEEQGPLLFALEIDANDLGCVPNPPSS
jgi:hypothetical protein